MTRKKKEISVADLMEEEVPVLSLVCFLEGLKARELPVSPEAVVAADQGLRLLKRLPPVEAYFFCLEKLSRGYRSLVC